MPYNKNQVPDAPLPVSMMPRVVTPASSDLVYAVQPGNQPGNRSRALQLGVLLASNIFKTALQQLLGTDEFNASVKDLFNTQAFQDAARGQIRFTDVVNYQGALSTNPVSPTPIVEVDVDPRDQVVFLVDGMSNEPTYSEGGSTWTHVLKSDVNTYFSPGSDVDYHRSEVIFGGVANIAQGQILNWGNWNGIYHGEFHELPHEYAIPSWYDPTNPDHPKKEVTLRLLCALDNSPYKPIPPTTYNLNIQAIVYRQQWALDLIQDLNATP